MTDQPPDYPPPGGYGYSPPPPPGYGYQSSPPGGYGYPSPWPQYPQPAGTNGFAIASIACSAAGLICLGTGSFLGIIFGIVALNQIKRTGQDGRGLAIAGIVIGSVVTVGFLILVLIGGIFGSRDANDDYRRYDRYDSLAPSIVLNTVEAQPIGLVNSR